MHSLGTLLQPCLGVRLKVLLEADAPKMWATSRTALEVASFFSFLSPSPTCLPAFNSLRFSTEFSLGKKVLEM